MKIGNALGMGLGIAILAAVGFAGYRIVTGQQQAHRQPSAPSAYAPPVATQGNTLPVSPVAPPPKSQAAEAKEWIGVAGDVLDLAGDLVTDVKGWVN